MKELTNKYMITEELTGHFFYHISEKDSYTKSICGSETITMQTSIPLDAWGFVGHCRERYCVPCYKIYTKEKEKNK